MPVNTKSIEDQIVALANKCETLVLDDSQPWDGDDGRKKRLDAMEADLKALEEKRATLLSVDGVRAKFDQIASQNDDVNERMRQVAVKSLGEQVTESQAYLDIAPRLKGGQGSSGGIELKAGGILGETAFAGTEAGSSSTAGGAGLLVPQYLTQPVQKLFRRLTVEDLIPNGTLSGSSLIYPVETTVTNNAAAVAEGGLKPLSDLGLTNVTETLKTIATRLKISDEMIQDVPFIQSYVNGRLTLFVQLATEMQLLSGDGNGANVSGILDRAGLQTTVALTQASGLPTAVTKLEAIYQQITNIRVNAFVEPDAIVMDPVSWQQLRMGRDANGQWYGGGPFTGAYGNSGMVADNSVLSAGGTDVWQLRTVITPAMTAGQALVGGFQVGAQVFNKGGLVVEFTNSNQDDFDHDLISIRAQRRLLLAVYRPGAFGLITGLNLAPGA